MIEVAPNLFVGSQADLEGMRTMEGWRIVHACKEPHHRQALGYSGRAAPKDHPEYLFCTRNRGQRMILNLVDVDNPAYVSPRIIRAAVDFIHAARADNCKVLVHCNQGRSRSPTIAMLAMAADLVDDFDVAEAEFSNLYPDYQPARGMNEFARAHWPAYRGG